MADTKSFQKLCRQGKKTFSWWYESTLKNFSIKPPNKTWPIRRQRFNWIIAPIKQFVHVVVYTWQWGSLRIYLWIKSHYPQSFTTHLLAYWEMYILSIRVCVTLNCLAKIRNKTKIYSSFFLKVLLSLLSFLLLHQSPVWFLGSEDHCYPCLFVPIT